MATSWAIFRAVQQAADLPTTLSVNGVTIQLISKNGTAAIMPIVTLETGHTMRVLLHMHLMSEGGVQAGNVHVDWKKLFTALNEIQLLEFKAVDESGHLYLQPMITNFLPLKIDAEESYVISDYAFIAASGGVQATQELQTGLKMFSGNGLTQIKLTGSGIALIQDRRQLHVINVPRESSKEINVLIDGKNIVARQSTLQTSIEGLGENLGDRMQTGKHFLVRIKGGYGKLVVATTISSVNVMSMLLNGQQEIRDRLNKLVFSNTVASVSHALS